MAFNPFREDRQRRMQELLSVVQKHRVCDLDWLLGWGGLRWGSTEDAIMRMLRQLEKARVLEINNEEHKVVSLIETPAEAQPEELRKREEALKKRLSGEE
jgi:hypothetical protein